MWTWKTTNRQSILRLGRHRKSQNLQRRLLGPCGLRLHVEIATPGKENHPAPFAFASQIQKSHVQETVCTRYIGPKFWVTSRCLFTRDAHIHNGYIYGLIFSFSAFILYRQHNQAAVVAQNPGLANPEISKIIGDHWRNLSPGDKNHWKLLADVSRSPTIPNTHMANNHLGRKTPPPKTIPRLPLPTTPKRPQQQHLSLPTLLHRNIPTQVSQVRRPQHRHLKHDVQLHLLLQRPNPRNTLFPSKLRQDSPHRQCKSIYA